MFDFNYDEFYFDGADLDDNYGMSVYDQSQLDWAIKESSYSNSVVDEEGGEF